MNIDVLVQELQDRAGNADLVVDEEDEETYGDLTDALLMDLAARAIERLREALQYYADADYDYNGDRVLDVEEDRGETARLALGQEHPDSHYGETSCSGCGASHRSKRCP